MRVFQDGQGVAELFVRYRHLLHHLEDGADLTALMQFELALLALCGYELNLWQDDATHAAIQPELSYHFQAERGLLPLHNVSNQQVTLSPQQAQSGVLIPGELLIALREPEKMQYEHWQQLRGVLDRMLSLQLNGKKLYARQLLNTKA